MRKTNPVIWFPLLPVPVPILIKPGYYGKIQEYSSKATNHSLLFSRAISSSLLHCAREREGKSEEYADSIQFRVRDSLLIWKPSPGPRSDEDDGVTRMGANSIPTDATIDLDEQISQLMQCKPLSEQQVPATLSVDDKLFLCPLTFSSTWTRVVSNDWIC